MEDQLKNREQLIAELNDLKLKYHELDISFKETIQKNQILLDTIINNIPCSVFVKDKNYRKLVANESHLKRMRAHIKSIGLNPDTDILGKTDFEVTSFEVSQDYFADDQKVIRDGESILNKEEEGFDPEGNPINLIITKIPLKDHQGEIIGMVGITSDVTELRQIGEEVKLKNEQLIKINAEKDKFFSIIAHDLRSPFTSIMGFSELLLDQVKVRDYKGVEEYADIILKSSTRAVDLLMNLMYWARSQTGRIAFNPVKIDMRSLIGETILLFEEIAQQKNISIGKKIDADISALADKAMISTVLRNLLSNAIKFTYPGGTIHIAVESTPNALLVSVRDNGMGISKTNLEKIFRLDETTSTTGTQQEKGTGLGLILCKEFIEKHQKRIWVVSKVGEGSTFYFTLPVGPKNS